MITKNNIKDYLLDINNNQFLTTTLTTILFYILIIILISFEKYELLKYMLTISIFVKISFYFVVLRLKKKWNLV